MLTGIRVIGLGTWVAILGMVISAFFFRHGTEEDAALVFVTIRDFIVVVVAASFWVCWILDYLFHDYPSKDHFVFKGGTSLSKAFGAIERFSEDIDLILDWKLLGYSPEEP
jgi:hypothetical protein